MITPYHLSNLTPQLSLPAKIDDLVANKSKGFASERLHSISVLCFWFSYRVLTELKLSETPWVSFFSLSKCFHTWGLLSYKMEGDVTFGWRCISSRQTARRSGWWIKHGSSLRLFPSHRPGLSAGCCCSTCCKLDPWLTNKKTHRDKLVCL